MCSQFHIFHFNDVYDIEEQLHEPKGGAARFLYVLNSLKAKLKNNITLFSGDVFSPSSLTNIYKGHQMVYPLQQFKIDVACLGNHDFDFTLEQLEKLLESSNTPWLLSNVYDKTTSKPLANALVYKTIEINGYKIGLFGLGEEEWLNLITDIPQEQIEYHDYVQTANSLCHFLRKDQNCNFIIALTHMRIPNDCNLIDSLEPGLIDLVLGGHDHVWHYEKIKNTFYAKSGTNFRNLGLLRIIKNNSQVEQITPEDLSFEIPPPQLFKLKDYTIEYYPINIFGSINVDPIMDTYVQEKIKIYNEHSLKVIGFTENELDARFITVRGQETTTANLFADIIRLEFQTDVAFLNCGTIRADETFSPGPITYQMIDKLFAIPDYLVSFKLTGMQLLDILENSVSKLPSADGRFLGVSGMRFTYSLNRPPKNRIINVTINDQPLELETVYTAGSKLFIAEGGDGFPHQQNFIKDKTLSILIKSTFISFFENIRKLKIQNNSIEDLKKTKYLRFSPLIYGIKSINEEQFIVVNPKIDGRIQVINL